MTENEVTGGAVKAMRKKLGLTQNAFWNPLGVLQSVSSRYESGAIEIPKPIRILIVAHYVSGVKIDACTPDGVEELAMLGAIQAKQRKVQEIARAARSDLTKAIKNLVAAREALLNIHS